MKIKPLIILLTLWVAFVSFSPPYWGFFGHRRINRLAVFTLPPEMIGFYKKNIEYLTEHAVDPDKRRYATRFEAPRHFIDIDHWGEYPFPQVPRNWIDALMRYTDLYAVTAQGDTLHILGPHVIAVEGNELVFTDSLDRRWQTKALTIGVYRDFFRRQIMPQYYEDAWVVQPDSLQALLGVAFDCREAFAVDGFSEYGIVPYHLLNMQNALTEAFRQGSVARILRLSAEFGHYIADAHVPLHTTENYNGQLTGQVGIHAFWESRVPELFADNTYNFFVGKARYIEQPRDYFWGVVLTSHRMVDSVLRVERELSETFPSDKQYCFDERLGATIRTQCREYAQAYQERLNGQMERRMRESILAVGNVWYTAWVDAGQPDLRRLGDLKWTAEDEQEMQALEAQFRRQAVKGRPHDGE